ncbi:glycoside hydrolase family 2 protein [Allorhizobium sp. BGMRC 0089]|uniref:glycoside hydrolase family 2 protein n=1 Tax=Allorhizobium sonneratiae TaxID=2934936 RepID=UPI0020341C33|nr:glycoside hydrolase family 2 TIM barrel-domain containing protein [Allorhizobium sonneratiae]MCM2294069.1 glycoside hydrolase family 2 protein [Allorhizobium sonneratiae]
MRSITAFNHDWIFYPGFDADKAGTRQEGQAVTLPHSAVELPFAYFDEKSYWQAFTYQKTLTADPAFDGKEVSLVFDGAMADSVVYLNGQEIGRHPDGYTPFEVRLTGLLTPGDNLLTVKVDGSENPAIPPFGARIDYLTYAGIYRDVWLKVTDPVSIENAKIETPEALSENKRVTVSVTLANPQKIAIAGSLTASLIDRDGVELGKSTVEVTGETAHIELTDLTNITLWDLHQPALYELVLTLEVSGSHDAQRIRFGFRDIAFTTEGFRLNGRLIKLRGLNRHQSFPYIGYALGRAAQEGDADILKHELKLNMVRTSHYPQSKCFLDRCDEIGLLVFEEIPGWQHIGDKAWQAASVENVRQMIRRDWNHPSIVLWGVRINESKDNHDFYVETNRVARSLDTTRPTTGVRCITDSELLEDVYSMNDFILGMEEINPDQPRTPLRPQQKVTGLDHAVPYMITEFNGHMYPTKAYDQEQRQAEHVIRHLDVLNAAYGDPQIAGALGWCAFDYNTHKDFGAGDRICHHGVMDMFREPKFAAFAYASQCEPEEGVILKPVTFWTRGERNFGGVLPLIILTNCDEVELVSGGMPPRRFTPDRERFAHLPHPPVIIKREDYPNQEFGHWGMGWQNVTCIGYIGGKKVAEVQYVADPVATTLQVKPDTVNIGAEDSVRVMVRVLDQVGNKLPFLFEPVSIAIDGPADLIGPSLVSLNGGSTGFWLQARGRGAIAASVTHARLGTVRVSLSASAGGGA